MADTIASIEMEDRLDFWVSPCPDNNATVAATIVVPTFNAGATLGRALRSALDQTLREIEVIIVDDASADSSREQIAGLLRSDRRLRCIRNKWNCGKPVGMNRAAALARGRWLAVLDADDWYHPDRLAALVAIGDRRGVDMVADNQFFYDGLAQQIVGTAWPAGADAWALIFDDFLDASHAYETFNLGMLKPVMRMDGVRAMSLSYEEKARHGQDFFHLLQFFLAGGRAVVADTPYYYYTQPFGRISRQWSHAARKRYDFQTAYEINERYWRAAAKSLTPSQARKLSQRNRRLQSLEHFYRARERLAAGDIGGAVLAVARHPHMLGYLAHRIAVRCTGMEPSRMIARVAARARRCDGEAAAQSP